MLSDKAVSPVIAAVLLIAFVMAAAAILSGWFVEFTKGAVKKEAETGEEIITCPLANIKIIDINYNCTTNKLFLYGQNSGRIDLRDFKLQVFFKNATTQWISSPSLLNSNITLKPGDIAAFSATLESDDLDKVILSSILCPVASQAKVKRDEITFVDC